VRAGIRRIRDRLLAEHLGMDVKTMSAAFDRAGSLCSLIDSRQTADRTLTAITPVTNQTVAPSATFRATLDPAEPIGFGAAVEHLVPSVEVTGRGSPLRIWILPAIAILAAVASSPAISARPEFHTVRDTLAGTSSLPPALWIGTLAFLAAGLLLVPLELLTIAAAVAFGPVRGGMVAAIGSVALAVVGYVAGRAIGAAGVARWISGRSYRSARQLGAHGVVGVVVLRLSSVASAGAIHLLCGAGRVAFVTFMAGTIIGVAPVIGALSALGGLLRGALLHSSMSNAFATIGAAVLLLVLASAMRTFLLIRHFAPSVVGHRDRAEFG
jgi:phospholipase D1/2